MKRKKDFTGKGRVAFMTGRMTKGMDLEDS